MKKIITLFFLLIVCFLFIKGQNYNFIISDTLKSNLKSVQTNSSIELNLPKVETPSVASMIKYINQPVNLSSGTVNVEIPIYELVENDIKIPISISYSTTGMKVKEANGRLGIGWSLHAESSISRQINGLPDETGYLVTSGNQSNYIKYYGYVANLADGENEKDENPDIFYYKLLDKSGKFYFNRGDDLDKPSSTIKIETVPFEPIKISYDKGSSLDSFEVIDDKGVLYRFTGVPSGLEKSGSNTISWKATEIISPMNNKISFDYKTYKTSSFNLTDYIVVEESVDAHTLTPDANFWTGCSNTKWPFITEKTANALTKINNINVDSYNEGVNIKYRGTVGETLSNCMHLSHYPETAGNTELQESLLEMIGTSSVKIEFIGDYFLDKINIIDKSSGTIIRSVRFYLSYYNNENPDFGTKRKLDKIEILDNKSNVTEKYSFSYNTPTSTPNLLNKNVDHWGYYNGISLAYSQSAVPKQVIEGGYYIGGQAKVNFNMPIGNANKEPSLYFTNVGTLQSITYPTGRKTSFTYELNQFRDVSVSGIPITNVGGLRIAKIQEFDPISNTILTRKFKYGENEDGAGDLKQKITLDNYKYQKIISYRSDLDAPGKLALANIYTSSPFSNIFYEGGSPVSYKNVAEFIYSGNRLIGKTSYKYANSNSFTSQTPNTTMVFDTGAPWNGSYLEEKIDYKVEENNDSISFKPVEKLEYKYQVFKKSKLKYGKAYRRIIFKPAAGDDGRWDGDQVEQNNGFIHQRHSHILGCLRLISEKNEIQISDKSSVVKETTYSYNNLNHMYATESNVYNSDGLLTQKVFKYPQDVSYATNSEEEIGRTNLINKNRLNILQQEDILIGTNLWSNKIKYTEDSTSKITLAKSVYSGKNGKIEEQSVIDKYYKSGRPAQVTTKGNLSTVYIWSYNNQYIIAELQNITFNQLADVISEDKLNIIASKAIPSTEDLLLINNLQKDNTMKEVLISTYTYQPLVGILESTDPSGITTHYEYDNFNRLKRTYIKEGTVERTIQNYNYNYINK